MATSTSLPCLTYLYILSVSETAPCISYLCKMYTTCYTTVSQPLRMLASQLSPKLNLNSLFYYPTMPTVSYVTGNVVQQMKSLVMSTLPHFLCNHIWPLLTDTVVWATVAWIRHSESVGMVMLTEAPMLRKCVCSWEDKTSYLTWWNVFNMINLQKVADWFCQKILASTVGSLATQRW